MDGWMAVLRKDTGHWSLTVLGWNVDSVIFSGTGAANSTSLNHFNKERMSISMVAPQPPLFAHCSSSGKGTNIW